MLPPPALPPVRSLGPLGVAAWPAERLDLSLGALARLAQNEEPGGPGGEAGSGGGLGEMTRRKREITGAHSAEQHEDVGLTKQHPDKWLRFQIGKPQADNISLRRLSAGGISLNGQVARQGRVASPSASSASVRASLCDVLERSQDRRCPYRRSCRTTPQRSAEILGGRVAVVVPALP